MSNPARELHTLYTAWRARVDEVKGSLENALQPFGEGASQMIVAMSLLTRIDTTLTRFELDGLKVDLYRRQQPGWASGVMSYAAGWKVNLTGEHVFTQAKLDEIEGFANYLDGKVLEYSDLQASELLHIVGRAQKALAEDTELDSLLSLYIHRLLQQIVEALTDQNFGIKFDVEAAAEELSVAFRAAEASSSKERASVWRELWTNMVGGAGGGLIGQGVTNAIRMITGG